MNPIIQRIRIELKLEQIAFRMSREENSSDLMRAYKTEESLLKNEYKSLTGREYTSEYIKESER